MKFNWEIFQETIYRLETPFIGFHVHKPANDKANLEYWINDDVFYTNQSVDEVKSMLEKILIKKIEKCKYWLLENNVSSLDDYIKNRQKLYWDGEFIDEDDFEESSKFQREIEISLTSAKHFKRRLE